MKKCIDCGKEVSGNNNKRCRKCNDFFKHGKNNSNFVHGMRKTRFYRIWTGIIARCNNKNCHAFSIYGGSGIKCLWKSFKEFRDDMYESYLEHIKEFGEKETTIDRINNDGNYYKQNCRWANWKVQQRNRRSNHLLTFQEKTISIAEWAEKTNINRGTLWSRLFQSKWSIEKTLTTPVIKGANQFSKHLLDKQ